MFKLPDLDFKNNVFSPFLSEEAMEVHYLKHHKAYTDNFNKALEKEKVFNKQPREIFENIEHYSVAVLNHGGGYWNHNFFWKSLSVDKSNIGETTQQLIDQFFDNFDNFQKQFNDSALSLFGSGWTWLVYNKDEKKLEILNTVNQENPLMSIISGEYEPLLVLDIWEHAYYVDYKNKRAEYVKNFWDFINWQKVEERLLRIL